MGVPLTIGLIVNDKKVPKHVNELIEWANGQPAIRVAGLIVVPEGDAERVPLAAQAVWEMIRRLEARRLKGSHFSGAFERSDAVVGTLSTNDAAHLDLLIQCDNVGHMDGVLPHARLGVIELGYGDDRAQRGGPPGLWEVLQKRGKTGFFIRHRDSNSARWRVVYRGFVPTQGYSLLNRAALLTRVQRYLKLLIEGVARSDALPTAMTCFPYAGVAPRAPGFFDGIRYIAAVLSRALQFKAKSALGLQERWGISFVQQDWQNASLWEGQRIENPPGRYFADPFLFVRDGETFCFVEDFPDSEGKGVISVLKMGEGSASFMGRVIEENFHLSFPFPFEYDGQLWMCPESHQSGQIRIYRCKKFPLEWELHSIAMEGVSAVDTMIFPSDGRWWMLTNIDSAVGTETFSELHLFSAPTPVGAEWVAHPMNPVLVDPQFARNAGMLRDGERLFRVSQERAFGSYGVSASISEITQLTATGYREALQLTLHPQFRVGLTGMHHFHSAGGVSVWDHKRWERAEQ